MSRSLCKLTAQRRVLWTFADAGSIARLMVPAFPFLESPPSAIFFTTVSGTCSK